MRTTTSLLPFLGSLASLTDAIALAKPAITFASPQQVSPGSAYNVEVEYTGPVDGELTIAYGSCSSPPTIAEATQHIGATHVGIHPLAARHAEHHEQRPTRFVWLAPEEMAGGCLRAFLDGELVGQSGELITKRLARRSEGRSSFADVAGEDMWFDGVAYLKQKQPDKSFVAAAKGNSFGILGGGISGLASSVSTSAAVWFTCVDG